ncbi:MAG: MBL fold metallo-hydrolase [Eggerthellaceae bacterium]|nr:MBL fold metallo-hydrolase [Eggerthellaceae bacterium]
MLTRRGFFKYATVIGAATLGAVPLAACSSGDGSASSSAAASGASDSSAASSAGQVESSGSSAAQSSEATGSSEASSAQGGTAKVLYLGQGSLRISTPEGKVIYVDPYAGDGYDLAADLILVTHGHFDHNALDKITLRNDGCQIITQDDALAGGEHQTFDLGYATIVAVQAGFNAYHDVSSCVGYVIELSNGVRVYASGDTSTTDEMRDGTLAAMDIDYAFWCSDGVYNMGNEEAAEAARMVGAKHNIPYHNAPTDSGEVFDPDAAANFDAPNALVVQPGEEITL